MNFTQKKHLGQPEFIALIGMLFATVAFSIDAMLPAMSDIAEELTPDAPNRATLIITSFVLGMGLGTLVTGPLSDAFGRKKVILAGAVVYSLGAALAWAAQSLELVLAARVLQGLGAAGPRVAALAIVRDLYAGRQMARVMSFAMIVFTLVPAAAPLIGSWIIWLSDWRSIFIAFVVFALCCNGWLALRQPETLAPDRRRRFSMRKIRAGIVEVMAIHRVSLSIFALGFVFAILFSTISTVQQIFEQSFDRADEFPYWFGAVALLSGLASLLNAHLVMRLGMRRVIVLTLVVETAISVALSFAILVGALTGPVYFAAFVLWMVSVFFVAGLTIGNLNALGMEPLGHLAGLGASIVGSVSTIVAVIIALPIGFAFDGTPLPLAIGTAVCSICSLFLICVMGSEDP